jgi:ribosomal protein S10
MATDKKTGEAILRIRVRAYENKVLDASVKQIIETANRHEATFEDPYRFPTKFENTQSTVRHSSTRTLVNNLKFVYTNV